MLMQGSKGTLPGFSILCTPFVAQVLNSIEFCTNLITDVKSECVCRKSYTCNIASLYGVFVH